MAIAAQQHPPLSPRGDGGRKNTPRAPHFPCEQRCVDCDLTANESSALHRASSQAAGLPLFFVVLRVLFLNFFSTHRKKRGAEREESFDECWRRDKRNVFGQKKKLREIIKLLLKINCLFLVQ